MERKVHLVAWDDVTNRKDLGGLGIRSMRCLNSALMLKLGWRLRAEPMSLWSRVLRHKYCNGLDTIPNICRKSSPNVWKGIMAHKDLLQRNVGLSIGDGQTTHFWTDPWVLDKPLVDVTTLPVPQEELAQKVSNYWVSGQGWRWDAIHNYVPSDILKQIASFEVLTEGNSDRAFWRGEPSGQFSIKSATSLLRHEPQPRPIDS